MKLLSFGAGMQSTALALMSCENKLARSAKHLQVPVYDAVLFCDLGFEPPWVMRQVDFVKDACKKADIPFHMLDAPLYRDFIQSFGNRRTISIPWWTLRADGHKSKMPRNCTIDYKTGVIARFVRWELLGYRKGRRLRIEDEKAHEMHLGFSAEEAHRCKDNPNRLFVNRFPLVEMGLTRADNFAYIRDVWGLETKASACAFCPFHTNYYYLYLKRKEPETYQKILAVDRLLRDKTPKPPMDSDLFISKSRKRIADLTEADCSDMERFSYRGQLIWNGF